MDIFERIAKDSGGPLGQYRDKAFGYFMFPKLEGELGPHMRFQGEEVLCWSLNNYLGLANHPAIRKVDGEAAARWDRACSPATPPCTSNWSANWLISRRKKMRFSSTSVTRASSRPSIRSCHATM